MTTNGIKTILLETHNFGKTVAFWKSLGYLVEFETGHNSGQLRHSAGGPALFVAERSPEQPLKLVLGVTVDDARRFEPPKSGGVQGPFKAEHWGALQMLLTDPDGREVAVEAPLETAKPHG